MRKTKRSETKKLIKEWFRRKFDDWNKHKEVEPFYGHYIIIIFELLYITIKTKWTVNTYFFIFFFSEFRFLQYWLWRYVKKKTDV